MSCLDVPRRNHASTSDFGLNHRTLAPAGTPSLEGSTARRLPYRVLSSLWALGLAGCVTSSEPASPLEPRPLGRAFTATEAPAVGRTSHTVRLAEMPEPNGNLDLRQALALALQRNPTLLAFSWEVRAAEARALQASLWPNPEASVDVENVGGDLQGFRDSETTVALAQSILFGWQRSRARRLAAAERNLAGWDYEAKRLDVFSGVVQGFLGVLGAQERVKLVEETARIADEVRSAATKRVELGDAPPVEQTRAEVVHAQVLTELDRARQALHAARIRLAAWWGTADPRFTEARGTLETDASLPPLDQLRRRLEQNPELQRAAAGAVKRQAALDWERARRVPEVSALAGYRRIEGDRVNTLVFGVSVPLPLFDRNQAAVREARANLAKAQSEQQSAEVGVFAALAEAHGELAAALQEQRAYTERILPGATDAFRKTQIGYTQGTFDYLELLTAQEALAKTRADYVEVLVRLNQTLASLERLVGEPITAPAPSPN